MLFNSTEFLLFLIIVFLLYWFVFQRNLRVQNLFVLVSSLVFYGWWDWRFLSLILISSVIDYLVGLSLSRTEDAKKRKSLLYLSLLSNLGMLGVFKYFDFFSNSFTDLMHTLGFQVDFVTLNIILPVGISFYTFQTLSYTIDVYRGKLTATRDFIAFFSFVSFFPQLVAGPIERAKDLLPQFYVARVFDRSKAQDGLRQILWGLFKKIVVADNCAVYVDNIFQNYESLPASYLVMGIFYFAFQIYGDFSGYSDIAIGTARLFGFKLHQNFAFPYFSRDIAEFWRRWHISLSSWFRDYLYIPLGGNKVAESRRLINIIIVFVVSGFWHGANWTFIIWGLLNGLYFLPLAIAKTHRNNTDTIAENRILPSARDLINVFITFAITLFAWIFFRSESIAQAFSYTAHIFSTSVFQMPTSMKSILPLILLLILVEWFQRNKQHGLEIERLPQVGRWATYVFLIGIIAYFSTDQDVAFIYFQF